MRLGGCTGVLSSSRLTNRRVSQPSRPPSVSAAGAGRTGFGWGGCPTARMLVVRFDRSFKGREDRNMGDRLMSEMSGIANWSLVGLSRLRANGFRFTVGAQGRAEVEDAARSQSPALRFAEARLNVTGVEADFTPMAVIYQSYLDWATSEGLNRNEVRNQTDLAHDLRAALPGVRKTQRRINRKAEGAHSLKGVQCRCEPGKLGREESCRGRVRVHGADQPGVGDAEAIQNWCHGRATQLLLYQPLQLGPGQQDEPLQNAGRCDHCRR